MDLSENRHLAAQLREGADLLHEQGANPYRAEAFRHAADSVERCLRPLREIFDAKGRAGLQELPGVGSGIATVLSELLITGRWLQLERLRGGADAEAELPTSPVRTAPDVALLLDVDREYRAKAAAGRLVTIAPKRMNHFRRRWLPVLHARRGEWHFTALFSNTPRAHELGKTHDWVVIYFYDGDHHEAQCTVVTETRGRLAGRRVVRGREVECRVLYGAAVPQPA